MQTTCHFLQADRFLISTSCGGTQYFATALILDLQKVILSFEDFIGVTIPGVFSLLRDERQSPMCTR
jgi:hypothetical protein